MTYQFSEHDLWGPGSNRVATMAPGPDDLFVVVTVFAKRIVVLPISDYEKALAMANSMANRVRGERPVTIKVLPMSFAELVAHTGTTREEIAKSLTPADRAECRQVIIDGCWRVLRESNDPAVRADALELLTGMGVPKQ
jgi:hypothetical protein